MAPVLMELKKESRLFDTKVVVTGQHRGMLDQTLSTFGITVDHDLNIMTQDQTLDQVLTRALVGTGEVLDATTPDVVLVQGDTTTAMAAALAAHHRQIKVGHVEAGLRSFDKHNRFPEEINRTTIDSIADFCFAPTDLSRANLLKAGIPENKIFVTGNTVVDALLMISKEEHKFENKDLDAIDFVQHRVILLTTHRRENYLTGDIHNIMQGVNALLKKHRDLHIVFPLHPNPNVRSAVEKSMNKSDRMHAVEPLSYRDLVGVMRRCYLVLTDSGGIQEEAPAFGKPVLVLRSVTERPEGVMSGVAKLVGTNASTIIAEVERLFDANAYEKMARAVNPYGDGTAAKKITNILKDNL